MAVHTDTSTPFASQLSGHRLIALARVAAAGTDICQDTAVYLRRGIDCSLPIKACELAAWWGLKAGVVTMAIASSQAAANPDSTRPLVQPVEMPACAVTDIINATAEHRADDPFEPLVFEWSKAEFAAEQALRAYTDELYADH